MKQILRSQLLASGLTDFDVQVAAHAHEMRKWRDHMARVAEDEKNEVPLHNRYAAHPAPRVHALVEAALDEDGAPSFEIVEDGPTPEQILAARKLALIAAVSHAERAAIDLVVPLGKRRLLNMRESDIRRADAELAVRLAAGHAEKVGRLTADHAAAMTLHRKAVDDHEVGERRRGLLSRTAIAAGIISPPGPPAAPAPPDLPPPPDATAAIEAERAPDDSRHLEEQQARRDRIAAIGRAAAQAHHDIEDLTGETIDGWMIPDFN